jgi:hypothetical protein
MDKKELEKMTKKELIAHIQESYMLIKKEIIEKIIDIPHIFEMFPVLTHICNGTYDARLTNPYNILKTIAYFRNLKMYDISDELRKIYGDVNFKFKNVDSGHGTISEEVSCLYLDHSEKLLSKDNSYSQIAKYITYQRRISPLEEPFYIPKESTTNIWEIEMRIEQLKEYLKECLSRKYSKENEKQQKVLEEDIKIWEKKL